MSESGERAARARTIRSYILREGRMTSAQARAMRELWPLYGVADTSAALDLARLFGREAARVLEIGFGRGDALLAMAEEYPGSDFLGVEVHRPGIGHLLNGIAERGLTNVRVLRGDAAELVRRCLPDNAFDRVFILFPDPWPKKRHNKRRLISRAFVARLERKLVPGGELLIATDSESYGEQIREVLDGAGLLALEPTAGAVPRTKYAQRASERGAKIIEFACHRIQER